MSAIRTLTALTVLTAIVSCGRQADDFTVMKGPFRQSFTETGHLEAISSVAIMVPRIRWEYGYEFKVIGMLESGTAVKAGDSVVSLDPSSIQKVIITKEEELETQKASSKKQLVQMANNIQDLKAQLRTEEAMFDLRKLELERSKFDTEKNRKVKELEFKQATIRMDKLKRQLRQKPVMDNYDYKIQKIKEDQVLAELQGAREALNAMVLRSPVDGIFQPGDNDRYWPPRSLKLGDRAYSGSRVGKIPDITHMKVRTFVHETDITKIFLNMPVLVRMDALPELAFHAKITDIGRVTGLQDKQMIFRVVVEIDESDLRLKPGMTVSCEYIVSEVDQAVYVPNSCLLREDGKCFVFRKSGRRTVKTEVQAGPSNSHHTQILSGAEPGDPLVPFDEILTKKSA
jgi:multidrug efflux pump subunit AcrA (membrane-fusion protein)